MPLPFVLLCVGIVLLEVAALLKDIARHLKALRGR